jgi:hypothetical protein
MSDQTDFNDMDHNIAEQVNSAKTLKEKKQEELKEKKREKLQAAKDAVGKLNGADPGAWFEDKILEALTFLYNKSKPDYERAISQARRAKASIKALKSAIAERSKGKARQGETLNVTFEMLDTEPLTMRRPLALLGGKSYAAIWPIVQSTIAESVNDKGEAVKHDPPIVHTAHSLMVVSGDGDVFGIGNLPMSKLDIAVHLPWAIPPDKAWSVPGVKSYRNGRSPGPSDVFNRVTDIVDRFIDFNLSLADQKTMSEMVSCYILGTWFLDAFKVIGYLWPNGDPGSGKSQLQAVISEISYLGQLILSGGSYPCLRDMADYGATLGFDDAEGLTDPKRTDPDKRALLLAGNRKGNTILVKEPLPGGGWTTRFVQTFCPRTFSATQLPDPILASRSIIVPLVRTQDRDKANADPMDFSLWPHDRRKLVDDLWALALSRLPELPEFDARIGNIASLSGRNLEPWRALLAVAAWLDENGTNGIFDKMNALSAAYQEERLDMEPGNLSAIIVRALLNCAVNAVSAVMPLSSEGTDKFARTPFEFKTHQITDGAKSVVEDLELDFNLEAINTRRVGRALGKMRFRKSRDSKSKGWLVRLADLQRLSISYGVRFPEELENVRTQMPLA